MSQTTQGPAVAQKRAVQQGLVTLQNMLRSPDNTHRADCPLITRNG